MPAEPFLERLMNTYGDALLRMSYLYLKDYHLAEDAVQETFLKALRSYESFEHKSSEKTWLTRIAINCCKNMMRTHWFQIMQNRLEESHEERGANPIDDFVEKDSLSASIMKLNANDRQVIILYYYQTLSVKEIAVIINKSENTTLQRLNRARQKLKNIAVCMMILCLITTTAFAGYHIYQKIRVNQTSLPDLDAMQIVTINPLQEKANQYGVIDQNFKDYHTIQSKLGIHLLDTDLSKHNAYMLANLTTDKKDYATVTIDNYILGDTSNYHYITDEHRYSYDHGSTYFTPVSLTVDMILSQQQMQNGWDTEYLGYYQFRENYISKKGYKVNIVESKTKEQQDILTEKVAIFVADGVRYTLKGRISINILKSIVDSMG